MGFYNRIRELWGADPDFSGVPLWTVSDAARSGRVSAEGELAAARREVQDQLAQLRDVAPYADTSVLPTPDWDGGVASTQDLRSWAATLRWQARNAADEASQAREESRARTQQALTDLARGQDYRATNPQHPDNGDSFSGAPFGGSPADSYSEGPGANTLSAPAESVPLPWLHTREQQKYRIPTRQSAESTPQNTPSQVDTVATAQQLKQAVFHAYTLDNTPRGFINPDCSGDEWGFDDYSELITDSETALRRYLEAHPELEHNEHFCNYYAEYREESREVVEDQIRLASEVDRRLEEEFGEDFLRHTDPESVETVADARDRIGAEVDEEIHCRSFGEPANDQPGAERAPIERATDGSPPSATPAASASMGFGFVGRSRESAEHTVADSRPDSASVSVPGSLQLARESMNQFRAERGAPAQADVEWGRSSRVRAWQAESASRHDGDQRGQLGDELA